MQLRRKMLDQIRERGMDLLLRDQVIVIQDQHKVVLAVQHKIAEGIQNVDEWRGFWRLQILEQGGKAFWLLLIQGRKGIGPEEARVIVLLVQGNPGYQRMASFQGLCPAREQHRFAKASGSRDQRQWLFQTLVKQGL